MKTGKKSYRPALGVLTATAVLLSGCSSSGSEGTVRAQLGWTYNTENGVWCAAQENGYWSDRDIRVDITPGGVNAVKGEQAIAGGSADVAAVGTQSAITAINEGADLVMIGAVLQKNTGALISMPNSPVTSLEDMVGRTVGVNPAQSVPIEKAMEQEGLGGYRSIATADPQALINGEVDVLYGSINNQPMVMRDAGEDPIVLPMEDVGLHDYGQIIVASPDFVSDHRDTVVKFLAGMVEGVDFYVSEPDAVADLAVNHCGKDLGLDPEVTQAQAAGWGNFLSTGTAERDGLMWISEERMLDEVYPVMEDYFGIPTLPDLSDLVDMSLLEEAYGLVNRN